MLVGSRKADTDSTALRFSLDYTVVPPRLSWTGRVVLPGELQDDLIQSDRGVVVPLRGAAHASITLKDSSFAAISACTP